MSSDGTRLDHFNQMALPAGLVVNGEIKNQEGFVSVMRSLLTTAKPHPIDFDQDVVVGVSDNRVFLREFTVPKYAGKDIEEAINFQVRSLLPVLPAGVETDWQIIGRDSEDQVEVLLAALSKNVIDSYIEVCAAVGLNVVAIEPAVFANTRVIDPKQLENKNVLLVYVGDSFATFSYITNGNPRFSDFLLDPKFQKGGDIIKTIESYVNFANSKHENRKVSEIIVSGFNLQIENLVKTLVANKFPAVLAKSRLATPSVTGQGLLHTTQGLNLRSYTGGVSPNLLPISYRLSSVQIRYVSAWRTLLTSMIVVTTLGSVVLLYLYQSTQNKFASLSETKDRYEKQISQAENVFLVGKANELNILSDKLMILRKITGGEEDLLREIAAVTPQGIKLSGIFFGRGVDSVKLVDEKSTWMISGVASSRPLVLDFYDRLLAQPAFAESQLYFSSLEKEIGVSFRIASSKGI